MSVIKVTKDTVSVLCKCGATTDYKYSDAVVSPVAVQFPLCDVCKTYVSGVIANPYDEAWEHSLTEEGIKRQVIGQITHKFALENKDSKKKYGNDASIKESVLREGRHNAVPEKVDLFEAEPPKDEKIALEHFKKTGKPFINKQKQPVSSVPEGSKVLKAIAGKKQEA